MEHLCDYSAENTSHTYLKLHPTILKKWKDLVYKVVSDIQKVRIVTAGVPFVYKAAHQSYIRVEQWN